MNKYWNGPKQICGIEYLEIDPDINEDSIYDKKGVSIWWQKDALFNIRGWQTIQPEEKKTRSLSYTNSKNKS